MVLKCDPSDMTKIIKNTLKAHKHQRTIKFNAEHSIVHIVRQIAGQIETQNPKLLQLRQEHQPFALSSIMSARIAPKSNDEKLVLSTLNWRT